MTSKRVQQPHITGCVIGALVALAPLGLLACVPAYGEIYDVVISHGRVMDPESGLDDVRNLGISGGKVRAVSSDSLTGKQTIEARGLVVAPGFIDLHETALRKMTLLPAQLLETRAPTFKNKGRFRKGADADVTVFDPNRVIDKATFEEPLQYSEGIQFVLVNGVRVVKGAQFVERVYPGRAARAPISR